MSKSDAGDVPSPVKTQAECVIDRFAQRSFGRTRTEAREKGICVFCGQPLGEFRDALSKRESEISQTCQKCQDELDEHNRKMEALDDEEPPPEWYENEYAGLASFGGEGVYHIFGADTVDPLPDDRTDEHEK